MPLHEPCSKERLQLATHVRACLCDGQAILLDLRRNRYLSVSGPQCHWVTQAVRGWPTESCSGHAGSTEEPPPESLMRPLLRQGIVVRTSTDAQPPVALETPDRSLNALDAIASPAIGLRPLSRFALSVAGAALQLRFRSLHEVVLSVQRRSAGPASCDGSDPPQDLLLTAVAEFERLRPLAYTSRDKCLFDSLALSTYLSFQGLYPTWVVGVKTRPFAAHSWLQCGPVVLNDQHEYVRRYTPILAV